MDRFILLAPALLMLAVFSIGMIVFTTLHAIGRPPKLRHVKHNQLFGPFMAGYLVWMMMPVERALVGRVSANTVTALSLLLCALCGFTAAIGYIGAAVWLYAVAGILDVLDGRLARLNGQQTPAGALFDSVSDRWGEFFIFTGYIWYLKDSPWMLAAIGAIVASQMVSYTRARAEGLGISLSGGVMQRAERIVLVSVGVMAASWYGAEPATAHYAVPIIGVTLLICAVGSAATAISRWVLAYRKLTELAPRGSVPEIDADPTPTPQPTLQPFPVPQKLRESAELAPAAPRL